MEAAKLEKIVKDRYRKLKGERGFVSPSDLGTLRGDKMPSDQVRALIEIIAPLLPDPGQQ